MICRPEQIISTRYSRNRETASICSNDRGKGRVGEIPLQEMAVICKLRDTSRCVNTAVSDRDWGGSFGIGTGLINKAIYFTGKLLQNKSQPANTCTLCLTSLQPSWFMRVSVRHTTIILYPSFFDVLAFLHCRKAVSIPTFHTKLTFVNPIPVLEPMSCTSTSEKSIIQLNMHADSRSMKKYMFHGLFLCLHSNKPQY